MTAATIGPSYVADGSPTTSKRTTAAAEAAATEANFQKRPMPSPSAY